MTEDNTQLNLNALAVKAKTSEEAFNDLLSECRASIEYYVRLYTSRWNIERDEINQWALIEFWNAVRAYDPSAGPFSSFWRWVVKNRITTRIVRLTYGKNNEQMRIALRYDSPAGQEEGANVSVMYLLPNIKSAELVYLKQSLHNELCHELSRAISLCTDLEKLCTKLYYLDGCSYAEMQRVLKLRSIKPVDNALTRVRGKLRRDQKLVRLFTELQSF